MMTKKKKRWLVTKLSPSGTVLDWDPKDVLLEITPPAIGGVFQVEWACPKDNRSVRKLAEDNGVPKGVWLSFATNPESRTWIVVPEE